MEICKLEGFIIKLKEKGKTDKFVCWSNSYNWMHYLTKKEIKEYMASEGWQPKIYVTEGKAKQAVNKLQYIDKYEYEICPVYVTISDRD